MVFEIQSNEINNISSHKFYQPVKDLASIKTNMPDVPNLHETLMRISRIMFQDVLCNKIDSISVVKFDIDKFLTSWGISTIASQIWYDEVLNFIKDNRSKTTEYEFEFDVHKNKHIFGILYNLDDDDLPVNCMQDILGAVSFRDITYMKYAIPDIFEKTQWSEAEYKDAFSTTNKDSKYTPEALIEMLDDLFDNLMKFIDPCYGREYHLRD